MAFNGLNHRAGNDKRKGARWKESVDIVTFKTALNCISGDVRRYNTLFHPGFLVSLSYRLRRLRKYGVWYFQLLLPIDLLFGLIKRVLSDTTIPSCVPIGPGLYLPHPNGIIINHKANLGCNVTIFQQVTLGEWHGAAPVISDQCALYAGAKVFGGVLIGRNCKIGANSVVNRNILDNTSVSVCSPLLRQRISTANV